MRAAITMRATTFIPLLALTALAAWPATAAAAPAGRKVADAASVAAPDPAKMEEAGARFRRGVDLYAEGDLGGALVEFTRAYELAPRYKILYNIGQITYQQQDYLTTLRHFRRYLSEGGDDVPPPRKRDVQAEIRRLEQRIGRIDVQAAPETRILIDGIEAGAAPLASSVEANVGRRHVEAVSPAGDRWERFVDLAGGDAVTVVVGPIGRRWMRAASSDERRPFEDAPLPLGSIVDNPNGAAAGGGGRLWLPWTAAAVLAVGAGTAGFLAWKASRDLQDARNSYPANQDELSRLHDRTRTFSLIADGALGGAVLMAGISTYLTLRAPSSAGDHRAAGRLALLPLGAGLSALGSF
ncbi:MAG TPA: hypothetical protein VGL59_15550 [Polyangia bacterium]